MAKKQELTVTFANKPNIRLMYEAMARILGEQYGCEITVKTAEIEEKQSA